MIDACLIDVNGKVLKAFSLQTEDDLLLNVSPTDTVVRSWPPDWAHTWDGTQWVPVVPSLAEAKMNAWERLKAARDAALYGGFVWDGSRFDSDPIAQGRISGSFALASNAETAPLAFPKLWKLADNTGRTVSAVEMIAIGLALNDLVQPCIDAGDALLSQINAATSIAQLEGIVWPTS